MIDWHCHLLPGIDDGAGDMDEALQMARLLAKAGYREICCTPHRIKGVYDTSPVSVRAAVKSLQAELVRHKIDLTLHPGTEYYLDEYLVDCLDDPLTLPGNLMLVEIPGQGDSQIVMRIIAKVISAGLTPLIAHPERCRLLDPAEIRIGAGARLKQVLGLTPRKTPNDEQSPLLRHLLEVGCTFQGNLGSLAGFYGERVKRNALALKEAGYITHWGSDTHSIEQIGKLFNMEKR